MFSYRVRFVLGSDKCTSVTDMPAHSPEGAVFELEMRFKKTTIRVINVELGDECQNHAVPCLNEGHTCPRCDYHLNDEGECTECS